jgi:DNA-directed RNA polymerase subunit beta
VCSSDLSGSDLAEQAIYLGEMPVMIGGGEFIVNGAVRVIVSQLHRSPGVDFLIESKEGDRVLHGGRIIPERGSWIEIGVTQKDILVVKIDQSSKIPATVFLRAISPELGSTESILKLFYPVKSVPTNKLTSTMWAASQIVDTIPAKSSSKPAIKSARRLRSSSRATSRKSMSSRTSATRS